MGKAGSGARQHATITYKVIKNDLSPVAHPAMGRVLASFEPVRLGDATGRGAEPST